MCTRYEGWESQRLDDLCINNLSMQVFSDSGLSLSFLSALKRKSSFVVSKRK
jgi:hypothetical protein